MLLSKSQDALAVERDKQKALLDHVPGGVGIYDLYKGVATLQYLNAAYLDMMGLKKEDRAQYYGHDIAGVFHPEDRHALTEMIAEIYGGKRLTNIRFRVQNGSGKWQWLNLVMRVIPEKNEHYTGYANLYDFDRVIETQQQMEAAHKKEETLLSSIPGGIAIYHLKKNGKVATEYVSEPLAAMCGYTAEEFREYLKNDALINLVPEDIPAVNAAVEKCISEHSTISVTYRIYKKDKTPILIRLDANMIQSEPLAEDEIAVFYAVHTLVSAESRRIIEEQKTFGLLLNAVPAGIGVFEVKNGVLTQEYINDAFFEILHTTRAERARYTGTNVLQSTHADDLPRVRQAVEAMVRGKNAVQVDYRVINGMGSYTWFHVATSVAGREEGYIRFLAAFSDCTESKEQELQLLQNERAVELAQIQGNLAIWTYNLDKGVILQQIHSADKSSMGYQVRLENVPACFIETGDVYPEDVDKFLGAYRELQNGKEKIDITYRLRDQRTGKYAWLRMFYQRMENTDSNERVAVGFSMNVDKQQEAIERYHVEQALREQLNENVLMYVEYNLTQKRFEAGGKMTEAYAEFDWQNDAEDGYLTGLAKTVDADYVEQVAEKLAIPNLLKAFAAGETNVGVEFRGKAALDAPSAWYRAGAALAKRPDTGDVMAFIRIENIEKHKDRQLAIESSLTDGIESIAVIRVADGRAWIVQTHNDYVPASMKPYFTYDDAFVSRAHSAVVASEVQEDTAAARLSTVLRALETQEVYQYSVTTQKEGTPAKRQLFRFRYLDDRKTEVVLSISDITSIYMEEQEKKKQLEEALYEAHQASHAKAEFYSRMSHDMRTPMNGILGMAELSQDENDPAALKENIGKIKESGEYLLSLINDTLDIQRIESGKMKLEPGIVNTADMVRNILEMISVTAKAKGVVLKFDQGNADLNWYVRADALRLKQIFINLLSNAVKFTPPGGTVSFEFKLLSREGMVSHDVVYVRDTGVGMSEVFLKEGIFKPFSQESNAVSANYAGSGLGLSIAKSLVELMGGRIEVESELGIGTTFAVYLDFERVDEAEATAALQSEKKKSKNATIRLNSKCILLAEDHPLNAEITQKLLRKAGCKVVWAQNGQQAVEHFVAAPENSFDAILMDIRMPVMDGLAAAKAVRALDRADAKTVPIIAMTANAYAEDVKAALDAGMNAHLGKPIDVRLLYDTLAMYLPKKGGAAE